MTQLNFDSTTVEPSSAPEPVPAGWYNVIISASTSKSARSGRGEYLELEMTILDGPYANRKLWTLLNLWHENAQTVEIAQRDLSAICHAIGIARIEDSAELHNRPLQVKVVVEDNGSYGDRNQIKGYKAAGGAPTPPGGATMAQAPSAAPAAPAAAPRPAQAPGTTAAAPATPPWQRPAA